jgi:hypothetical protein
MCYQTRLDKFTTKEYACRGLAATINFIAGILSMAHMHKLAMLTSRRDPWVYAHNKGCFDFSCYFESWSNCSAGIHGEEAFVEGVFDVDRAAHKEVFGMVPHR